MRSLLLRGIPFLNSSQRKFQNYNLLLLLFSDGLSECMFFCFENVNVWEDLVYWVKTVNNLIRRYVAVTIYGHSLARPIQCGLGYVYKEEEYLCTKRVQSISKSCMCGVVILLSLHSFR